MLDIYVGTTLGTREVRLESVSDVNATTRHAYEDHEDRTGRAGRRRVSTRWVRSRECAVCVS